MPEETQNQTQTQTLSPVERFREKYGAQKATPRAEAYQAFDSQRTSSQDRKNLERISSMPKGYSGTSIGDLHAEIAGVEIDMANLADDYGKLNISFANILGKNRMWSAKDVLQYWAAHIPIYGSEKKRRDIRVEAARKRGNSLETIASKIAEVLNEQHQKSVKLKSTYQQLQIENVAFMKQKDRDLVRRLREGYVNKADYTEAEKEVSKFEKELSEFNDVLVEYEGKVNTAKGNGDIETVRKLTDEMNEILEMKSGVMDGKLAADGVVSDIRRAMLDAAEGVQSAKGAIAASRVNYLHFNGLIDAMNELEVKYKYAMDDMVPVFLMQARAASASKEALEIKEALLRTAALSNKLIDVNTKLVMHLTSESFKLLQTPIYDPAKMGEVESRVRGYMDQLNQMKVDWAANQRAVSDITRQIESPHYTEQR